MKNKNKKKSIIKLLLIIFVVFNAIWLINFVFRYGRFAIKVEYNKNIHSFHETDKEKNATYGVVMPSYPFFTSNIYLNSEYEDEGYDLYINPNLICGYEIGFIHTNKEGELVAEIWFDENMQLIDKYECIGTVDEYKEQIKELCDLAYDKWGFSIHDKE